MNNNSQDTMTLEEFIELRQNIELEQAKRKINYWQTAGTALLADDGLEQKWCEFVDIQANHTSVRGKLIDETLQIISMIKLKLNPTIITQTINEIPSGPTILDEYLPQFIQPEILQSVRLSINSKSRS